MAERCEIVSDQARASDSAQLGVTIVTNDTARAGDAAAFGVVATATDGAVAGDSASWSGGIALSDTARAGDSFAFGGSYHLTLVDGARASDHHAGGAQAVIADTPIASESVFLAVALTSTDGAIASDSAALGLALAVVDVATAGDAHVGGAKVVSTDTAIASDATSWTMSLLVVANDVATAGDSLAVSMALTTRFVDSAIAGDSLDTGGSYTMACADTAYAGDFSPAPARAYSVSTDLLAITEWSGVAGNSVASAYGMALIAAADGLIALRGDTDRAQPIVTARILTGLLDSASSTEAGDPGYARQRRIDKMYFSRRGANPLVVAVANTQIGDELVDFEYPTPFRIADVLTTERVSIGRGARARYFRFGVTNPDGGSFELRDWYASTTDTSRRL